MMFRNIWLLQMEKMINYIEVYEVCLIYIYIYIELLTCIGILYKLVFKFNYVIF
jgi:hypothetical protein